MTCEFCEGAGGPVLWQDACCRVVYVDAPGYPGYCRVVWHAHVREMTDLAPDERARFLRTVFEVEHAVRDLLSPDKVNLACLGNLTPHLHWHVIPRHADDPHFPLTIWAAPRRRVMRTHDPALPAAIARRLEASLPR